VIFFLLVSAGEISLRTFLGLKAPPLSISDPKIEYLFAPNQKVKRFRNKIFYNSYSMRNIFDPKLEDQVLLVAGDSVVNGGSLIDQKSLSTFLLQSHLNKNFNGKKFFVGNVSAGSWGPQNILEYFNKYGFFGATDLIYVLSTHDLFDVPSFSPLDRHALPQLNYYLALEELFFKYLKRLFVSLISKKSGTELDQKINFASTTENKIEALAMLAKEQGISVCFVIHPTRNEIENNIGDDYQNLVSIVENLSLGKVVDTKPLQNTVNYRDDIHLNESGQKNLTQALLQCL
jgi:hypothetical protein